MPHRWNIVPAGLVIEVRVFCRLGCGWGALAGARRLEVLVGLDDAALGSESLRMVASALTSRLDSPIALFTSPIG